MINSIKNFKFRLNKKKLLFSLISIIMLLFILIIIAFVKRDGLLKAAINKGIYKAKNNYNLNVKIGSYGFSGLGTVYFKDINVVPEDQPQLANIKNLKIGIKLWPLIFGNIKVAQFEMSQAAVTFIKKDSSSNYEFLFKKTKTDSTKAKSEIDLAELANKLFKKILDKIPEEMNVSQFLIKYTNDSTKLSLLTENATIINKVVEAKIKVNGNQAIWHIQGEAIPSKQFLDLKIYAEHQQVEIPYLQSKYHLKLGFDTIRTQLSKAEKNGDQFEIEGKWTVKNLLVNHTRIAANDILVKDASIAAKLLIGENYIALDSSSVIYAGKIKLNPFVKYTIRPNKIYEMQIHSDMQPAQEIFNAFPVGLFESLEGIKAKGNLKYGLNFYLDSSNPNDVIFNSSLAPSADFKIIKFGKTNFQKINSVFTYTPFEKGKPVRSIIVGPENPNYTPIGEISPNIKNALLTSEDPSFYWHKGFVEESIRQSIATNFKAKSFKRGGSTISMQLVKNIYLNRNKNLARKIEEILIVWLIENQRLSAKNRMYEVYLNIIEWGRNIYGIGEAARYYFDKSPKELNLGEAIYLAHIVPKPKSALYSWQSDGSLKPHLTGYYNLIGGLMAKRGYAINDSTNYGFYQVRLKESLRQQIQPELASDSLFEEEDDVLLNLDMFNPTKKDSLNRANLHQIQPSNTANNTRDSIVPTNKQNRKARKKLKQSEINN
jgi:hypothetical protein